LYVFIHIYKIAYSSINASPNKKSAAFVPFGRCWFDKTTNHLAWIYHPGGREDESLSPSNFPVPHFRHWNKAGALVDFVEEIFCQSVNDWHSEQNFLVITSGSRLDEPVSYVGFHIISIPLLEITCIGRSLHL